MILRDAIHTRRAVRRFRPEPVPRETLLDLLDLANRAPSSFNLQPWHFVVVDASEQKKKLRRLALDQAHVEAAGAVVIFCADPAAWREHLKPTERQAMNSGVFGLEYAGRRSRYIRLYFDGGPLGLLGVLKLVGSSLVRLFRPLPHLPVLQRKRRALVREEVMLAVAQFMLAARTSGLDTCPVGAFDGGRIKRAFGIPRRMEVVLLVPVGYALEPDAQRQPRLPLAEKVHWNGWSVVEGRGEPRVSYDRHARIGGGQKERGRARR